MSTAAQAAATAATFTNAIERLYLQVAETQVAKAEIERNTAELQRSNYDTIYKECRRPWKAQNAFVDFDEEKQVWRVTFQGVVAWGDTPEMACDNFDHLWMFGANI